MYSALLSTVKVDNMRARIALVAGIGIGYVLGARAGRESYEKIKTQATNVWHDPKVQEGIKATEETIKEKAPVVAEKAKEAAATAADKTKAKVEEVKETRAEHKAEKTAEKAVKDAPADVVSDPATAPEDEGPAVS